jgi:hypothetical protein
VPRGASANGRGGMNLPPCGLAGRTCRLWRWRKVAEAYEVYMAGDGLLDKARVKLNEKKRSYAATS